MVSSLIGLFEHRFGVDLWVSQKLTIVIKTLKRPHVDVLISRCFRPVNGPNFKMSQLTAKNSRLNKGLGSLSICLDPDRNLLEGFRNPLMV